MKKEANQYDIDFIKNAHKGSSSHKTEILDGDLCGCFHCKNVFSAREIKEWIKEREGETAVCPLCGIDSVLSSKFPINHKIFLEEMNQYWFS
ncbi:cytoplasmic protein [Flavobacterium procerum]|uniref:Cytoplasmic protein n=1 Tax=Flavobacterium procerum TaxID=1455569 RepID=A0ABV6BT45_9FLAO